MKGLCTLIIIFLHITANFLVVQQTFAQQPEITSFEPKIASFGEIITISGSGFTTTKADLKVLFGSVEAKINESTATAIRVSVPAGAANGPITVTQLPSGLTAFTNQPFYLSFGGLEDGDLQFSSFKKYPGSVTNGINDVCACDFDGDGKNDLAGSNPVSANITTYLNNSLPGEISYSTKKDIPVGGRTQYLNCGDLDGDGKPDLVLAGNGTDSEKVMILRNTSSPGIISFAAPKVLTATGKVLGRIAIHDLDGDGKPEIILSNQADNEVLIFKNTGTSGSVAFDPAFLPFKASTESISTLGLRIKDVNSDGMADITASSLYGSKVFFLINSSTKGNISFKTPTEFNTTSNISNHELEDLDGDGKHDLIVTDIFNHTINIHLNNSTSSSLSFSTSPTSLTTGRPMGLQLGDLNGDRKIDILTGHNNEAKAFGLVNTSTVGRLSFKTHLFADPLSTNGKFANIQIIDLDGDAKPDVVAVDRENGIYYAFRNLTCVFPSINPAGAVNVCGGSSVTLSTIQAPAPDPSAGPGAPALSYQWFQDGIVVGTGPTFQASNPGSYYVKLISTEGCSGTSKPVTVNFFNESIGDPIFNTVSQSCEGSELKLSITPAVEGATYTWTNTRSGFTQSTTTNTLTITKAEAALHSGIFKVLIANKCQKEVESPEIIIHPKPEAAITSEGTRVICSGEKRLLSLNEGFASYVWKKDGKIIPNENASGLTVGEAGSYTALIKNVNGCEVEVGPYVLEVNGNLKASFDGPSIACADHEVKFNNTSTWAAGKGVIYLWDFGDGTQSSAQSPTHTYTQAAGSTFTVSLTLQYEGSNCGSTFTRSLTVTNTPEIEIQAEGSTAFCEGDSVKVTLSGEIAGVKWSNGATGLFTYAKENGTLEAEVMTTAGCTTTKSIELSLLGAPVLELTAEKMELGRGETTVLQAVGGISYQWEPKVSLDDPTIPNPVASPDKTTTYKVRATGDNGCTAVGEITIVVDNSPKFECPKLFVPATDFVWIVPKIEFYPELSLTILNKFGKQVFAASTYHNNWDGTDGGRPLNDGVYFYVFKDSSGKIVKTGSITLVR